MRCGKRRGSARKGNGTHTMNLELNFKNIMDEKEDSDTEER